MSKKVSKVTNEELDKLLQGSNSSMKFKLVPIENESDNKPGKKKNFHLTKKQAKQIKRYVNKRCYEIRDAAYLTIAGDIHDIHCFIETLFLTLLMQYPDKSVQDEIINDFTKNLIQVYEHVNDQIEAGDGHALFSPAYFSQITRKVPEHTRRLKYHIHHEHGGMYNPDINKKNLIHDVSPQEDIMDTDHDEDSDIEYVDIIEYSQYKAIYDQLQKYKGYINRIITEAKNVNMGFLIHDYGIPEMVFTSVEPADPLASIPVDVIRDFKE